MNETIEIRCGNCRKFWSDNTNADGKRTGWCDEFAGVAIHEDFRCDGAAFKAKDEERNDRRD